LANLRQLLENLSEAERRLLDLSSRRKPQVIRLLSKTNKPGYELTFFLPQWLRLATMTRSGTAAS
jgi:hypothetical protein